ncbi:MAG: histidine phosphatase family protein [Pseudohongiellaceae bacterium]
MSELILVRHGQASFGKESYDKLSDNGIEQAKTLCRYWESTGERFDHVYSGTLLRQRETAAELLPLIAQDPTSSTENPAFNEYNGDPLIRIYLRDHHQNSADEISWPIKDPKQFQLLFEKATAKWITGDLQPQAEDEGFELFSEFQHRVHSALDEIMDRHSQGSKILISTSGGVIAMALQRVLQFPDEHVITTNWMVHNSAVTRIKYGRGRLSLSQFNNLAHLEAKDLSHMITYR